MSEILSTDPLAFIIALGQIGAGIAVLGGLFVPIGQGTVAAKAIEAIARQPEAAGTIRTTMFIGLATCETSGIYGLLISIVLLFSNPLVSQYLSNAAK